MGTLPSRFAWACGLGLTLASCSCQTPLVDDGKLTLSPGSLDFGVVGANGSRTQQVQLTNESRHRIDITVTVLGSSRADAFIAVAPSSVEPGTSTSLDVVYRGAATDSADVASLSVKDVSMDTDLRVVLAGRTHTELVDGGSDAGAPDAGPADAGATDAGPVDGGALDSGVPDAGPVDAGSVDAGVSDAGPDFPTFDGGGVCGAVNVLDLPLQPYPAALGLQRSEPSLVVTSTDFAMAWVESQADGGSSVMFARFAPSGRVLLAPRELAPAITDSVNLAWNGREFLAAWDEPSDAGLTWSTPLVERFDALGHPVPRSFGRGSPLYRPGMTNQVPAWNPATQEWALAWGWWQTISMVNTGTISVQRLDPDGGMFVGTAREIIAEAPWRSKALAAATDGGFVVVGGGGSHPITLRRLESDLTVRWTSAAVASINGSDLKVVTGGSTYGLVWRHFDGVANVGYFAVADLEGGVLSPVKLAPLARSVGSVDVAWNGGGYTTVLNEYSDAGWTIDETRFDEQGTRVAPLRRLTCTRPTFDPRVAAGHGVNVVTYEATPERRVLVFP